MVSDLGDHKVNLTMVRLCDPLFGSSSNKDYSTLQHIYIIYTLYYTILYYTILYYSILCYMGIGILDTPTYDLRFFRFSDLGFEIKV